MRLYLASTSPARLATLRAAGIEPVVLPSHVDEEAAVRAAEQLSGPLPAADMVQLLARTKAEAAVAIAASAVAESAGADAGADAGAGAGAGAGADAGADVDAETPASTTPITGLVLGGDSAFELDGAIYGKPHTPEVARERWLAQRGRTGLLHSGHWLLDVRDGRIVRGVGAASVASVTFADDITDAEIDSYIATGEPLAVAGAFTIDSLGAAFITGIVGDPHTVVGLSVSVLRRLVRELESDWTALWNRGTASA